MAFSSLYFAGDAYSGSRCISHRETASDDVTVYISGYTGGTVLSAVMIENGIIGAVGAFLSPMVLGSRIADFSIYSLLVKEVEDTRAK